MAITNVLRYALTRMMLCASAIAMQIQFLRQCLGLQILAPASTLFCSNTMTAGPLQRAGSFLSCAALVAPRTASVAGVSEHMQHATCKGSQKKGSACREGTNEYEKHSIKRKIGYRPYNPSPDDIVCKSMWVDERRRNGLINDEKAYQLQGSSLIREAMRMEAKKRESKKRERRKPSY